MFHTQVMNPLLLRTVNHNSTSVAVLTLSNGSIAVNVGHVIDLQNRSPTDTVSAFLSVVNVDILQVHSLVIPTGDLAGVYVDTNIVFQILVPWLVANCRSPGIPLTFLHTHVRTPTIVPRHLRIQRDVLFEELITHICTTIDTTVTARVTTTTDYRDLMTSIATTVGVTSTTPDDTEGIVVDTREFVKYRLARMLTAATGVPTSDVAFSYMLPFVHSVMLCVRDTYRPATQPLPMQPPLPGVPSIVSSCDWIGLLQYLIVVSLQ
jgi:hypothetical protein